MAEKNMMKNVYYDPAHLSSGMFLEGCTGGSQEKNVSF